MLLLLYVNASLTWSICLCSQPISSTWYDYWGADYGTYGYNPYIGGVGIPVAKPPVAAEKPGSQGLSVSVSQGEWRPDTFFLLEIVQHGHFLFRRKNARRMGRGSLILRSLLSRTK